MSENRSGDLHECAVLSQKLDEMVIRPMKQTFVAKDEIIDLMALCLIARENLFVLGPPGTAKSALVQEMARRISGNVFDYLLTRFTEPNELFGPFDIRKLREGELQTNTDGMLPEATFVFLDELLNANSAILNSLLMVLNERVFRRGREFRQLPTLMVVGASNRLPEDEALGALFDRFLIRVPCNNVDSDHLENVLRAGWELDGRGDNQVERFDESDVSRMHSYLHLVELQGVIPHYVQLVCDLRKAGIAVSDRRAVKLQRMLASSALISGRLTANRTDLWVLRYIWDTESQQEVIAAIVDDSVAEAPEGEQIESHPRALPGSRPDPEVIARDLEDLKARFRECQVSDVAWSVASDQLARLAARCHWIEDTQQREFLQARVQEVWADRNQKEGSA